jgi:hypothetical protein
MEVPTVGLFDYAVAGELTAAIDAKNAHG